MTDNATMPLSMVQAGEKVTLATIDAGDDLRSRLAAMGMVPNTEILIVSNSRPGPFVVNVKGTRIAIGSNLAIVLLSSLAAFLGKALTGQIVWSLTVPIVLTAIPAAYLGSLTSRRVPVAALRIILAICIGIAALRVGISAAGF